MKNKFALLFVFLFTFFSCNTSYITSAWKAPDFVPADYDKVMVVGIIREADRNLRVNLEKHMADDVRMLGYEATSAYESFGPHAFKSMNEEQVIEELAMKGVDAVITIVLLDKQRERYYVPGRVVYSPYVTYHNRFWGYYRSIYTRIEMPGYYQERARYFWESNFYDLRTKKLLYSVQTESFDASSSESLAHEHSKSIIASMVKSQILSKKTKTQEKPV